MSPLRRSMTIAAATLAAMLAPAAAHAATYTVKAGDGPCGSADLLCGSLAEAAQAAVAGDVFTLAAGNYEAATFDVGGVTIVGAAGVAIKGTMTFSGTTGGAARLARVAISQGSSNAPAINVSGNAGLLLVDAVAVSLNGDSIIFGGGGASKIVRSVAVTGGQQTSAVKVQSNSGTPDTTLTLESTILTGGGAGLGVFTKCLAIEPPAGDVTIHARHLTAAGSTNGVVLDASDAARLLSAGAGNISMNLVDSIALNNKTARYAVATGVNSATITDTRSLQSGDPKALFADAAGRNFRLRPGSPAIDVGGFTTGESDKDIDNEARPGPTTDIGADEYYNAAPIATIAVLTKRPRDGQPVQFDATGSTDREARYGGGIARYFWTFGDGATESTTTPRVSHTYKGEGTVTAQVVAVDIQGAQSAPATVSVTLVDGTPPAAVITKPFQNQTIKLTTSRVVTTDGVKETTEKKTKLSFSGVAKDKAGVAFVLLTIKKLGGKSGKCTWLDAKKGLRVRSCNKPAVIQARLNAAGIWSYSVASNIKQPSAGSYQVSVYAADSTGAYGNSAPEKERIVNFKLAKR